MALRRRAIFCTQTNLVIVRGYATPEGDACDRTALKRGLVLGAYEGCVPGDLKLSQTAAKYDEEVGGKITQLIKGAGVRLGTARVFNNLSPEYYAVAVAGVGSEGLGYNENEIINECKENIRIAAAVGARSLQDMGVEIIGVEGFTNTESAAEGASLAVWRYQDFKGKLNRATASKVELYEDPDRDGWTKGIFKAESQNLARKLSNAPANLMTPSAIAQTAVETLCPCGVSVEVRDKDWIESKRMTAFLGVSKASCEPPLFVEMSYCGGQEGDKPACLVGKGMTFDSGGICLRACKGMSEMRAEMAGAAVIIGALKAVGLMSIPCNVNAVIPLCENMPGGQASKPGDVLFGLNDRSQRIVKTSRPGRIMLSDALVYTNSYKPCIVISISTSTSGMKTAMGSSASGVFSTSNAVWKELSMAGAETGDRVWRFPFWKFFTDRVTAYHSTDLTNTTGHQGGDPCEAASYLLEFAPPADFVHMDITGAGKVSSGKGHPYLRAGNMTGRPTRTLIQFLYQMGCPQDKGSVC